MMSRCEVALIMASMSGLLMVCTEDITLGKTISTPTASAITETPTERAHSATTALVRR